MKILDCVDAWNLFKNKALNDNSKFKCPEHLEELGREIVGKCGGLPLAINIVGGLLFIQGESASGWTNVLKGIKSYLSRDGSDIYNILELSYQNLSPQLKPCFLCLAFWKEDSTIRAVKLKNIWITQGLIQHEGEETVEAIATRYLDELINRNLIQVKDISSDDQVKNCQVHDLIHELSITKAKEEIGFEMLRGEGSSQSSDKPRHRALYNSLINDENSRNKHICSLFVRVDVFLAPSSYWKSFELLKSLDLEDCETLRELPEAIGSLIGLTYLGLKKSGIWKLPCSFRKLKNLEVIELSNYIDFPSCAWGFTSLRHVDALTVWWEDVPRKTSSLKNIHRLKCLCIRGSDHFEQLAEMTRLCYLAIHVISLTDWSKVFNSLHTLENLVRLSISLDLSCQRVEGLDTLRHVTRLKLRGGMSKLPPNFPPKVSHLTLRGLFYEDPMPVLEKLPCLSYLYLYSAYGGEEMIVSSDGFSKLKILRFSYLLQLKSIQVGEGAMPELKRFEIRYCPQLNVQDPLRSAVVV